MSHPCRIKLSYEAFNVVRILLDANYGNCLLYYNRLVLQQVVQSVLIAAESALWGKAIITSTLTMVLDSVRAASDKDVQGTRVTLICYRGIPTRIPKHELRP